MEKIKITKLDAARRQIDTAIKLYFNNEDLVSINTLGSAGHEVLNDIAKTMGLKSIKDDFIESTPPGMRKFVVEKLNQAKNFMKHADKDPEGVLDYTPTSIDLWLLDCANMYKKITGNHTKLMIIFTAWFTLNHPELINFTTAGAKDINQSLQKFDRYKSNRTEFFKHSLVAVEIL